MGNGLMSYDEGGIGSKSWEHPDGKPAPAIDKGWTGKKIGAKAFGAAVGGTIGYAGYAAADKFMTADYVPTAGGIALGTGVSMLATSIMTKKLN